MLYFAYGSNLGPSTFAARCPTCKLAGIARADGFRLGFTRYSERRRGGVADLVPAPGAAVWGALYELSDADLAALDDIEGVPSAYVREVLTLQHADGATMSAWAYTVAAKAAEIRPSRMYWRLIVEGAKEVGLPGTYVALLEAIPFDE